MVGFEGYMHGVNLGGWLSQCDHTKQRYDTFIVEKDIETIKNWGLDHVRVPVDYNLVEDEEGNYKEEGFDYLQQIIDWCGKYELNMVLDLHKTYGFSFDEGEGESGFFDNADYQERFYRLWNEFSKRYGKYSERLCFEILNEVTEKKFSDKWNEISTKCIKVIRENAPDIKILLGGYYNNSIEALEDLAMPYDENVVYNFHCYEPLVFTHQGAYWAAGMNTEFRMPFKSTYGEYIEFSNKNLSNYAALEESTVAGLDKSKTIDAEYFNKMLETAVKVAEERNVRLYCGEYGVIDRASSEDALDWYKTICECFDNFGIGRAAWTYKEMDFGIMDAHMDPVREELVKVL